MNIREYTKSDYEAFVVLVAEYRAYTEPLEVNKFSRRLKTRAELCTFADQLLEDAKTMDGYVYVADNDGEIVGFVMGIIERFESMYKIMQISYEPHDVGHVGIICVSDKSRRLGVANALLVEAKKYIESKGCKLMKLQVLPGNDAKIVYEKAGFRVDDVEMLLEL